MPRKKTEPQAVSEPEFNEDTPMPVENPILSEPEPETPTAPVAPPPPEEPRYHVERSAESGAIPAEVLPRIICGVCEHCGPGVYDHSSPQRQTVDYSVPADTQIGQCEHYKGVRIRCVYCPMSASWSGNIAQRTHQVFVSPWDSKALIIVCSDMGCQGKHYKRAFGGKI